MMPEMDGYPGSRLPARRPSPATCFIPVIFLTALNDIQDEERGLEQGAADYITKPFLPTLVLARVRTQLEAKHARDWLRDKNAFLEAEVSRRVAENDLIQRVSIKALAHLAEIRDRRLATTFCAPRAMSVLWQCGLKITRASRRS